MTGQAQRGRSIAGAAIASPPRQADLRLLWPAVATWAAAAVGLRIALPVVLATGAGLAVGIVLVLSSARQRRWAAATVTVLGCAAAAMLSAGLRAELRRHGLVPDLARARASASMQLVVTGDPQQHPGRTSGSMRRSDLVSVAARVEEVTAAGRTSRVRMPVLVLASDPSWATLTPSQSLTCDGRLAPPRPGDAVAAVMSARGPPREVTAPSVVQATAGRLRAGLRSATDPLPAAERGLLPGLVDGDVSRLPPELADDFRTTGLTHLVAVSGSNVAIVLAAALFVGRRLRLGPRLASVAAAISLLGFVVLARPQPSVLRAAVMGGVAIVALATGRERSALSALFAAVTGLLLIDPDLASAAGFALSVLATLGLLVLAPGWRDRLARRLPGWLAEALAVPAAAQLACGPVIAMVAGSVSLVAVPANLLAVPAVAPATVLGVLTAVTAPVAMPVARLFARLAFVPVWWLVTVAHTGAVVPGSSLGWPAGAVGAVLLALTSAGLLAVLASRATRRIAAAALLGALLAVGVLRVTAPGWPPPGWALVACDVGQGDALVLAAGADSAVVVDAGPDPRLIDSCLRDLGVRRVPLVLLTHFHADHVEGLPGLLRHREVGGIEIGPLDAPVEELDRVRRWAAPAGIELRRAAVGDEQTSGRLRWQVLAPTRPFVGTNSDPNNSSVVLRVSTGQLTVLLTGDVEPPAQRALLDSGLDLHAEVLKVPHHGSESQDPRFVAAVGAAVAMTSVGAGNTYGHPSSATLAMLATDGMRSYRTDVDGSVAISAGATGIRAVARHGVGTPPAAVAMRPASGGAPIAATSTAAPAMVADRAGTTGSVAPAGSLRVDREPAAPTRAALPRLSPAGWPVRGPPPPR